MGFFDFVQDVGRRLFDADADAADSIKNHLEVKTTGITNLDVKYEDGTATICGDCESPAAKDLAVLIAGDIKGVTMVDASGLNAPEPAAETPAPTYHIVESGDTLGLISKRYYGKASMYMKIFQANQGLLSDPDKIYPGQKILIPAEGDVVEQASA